MSKYTDLINPQNNVANIANAISQGYQNGTLESNVTMDAEAVRGSIREHGVSRFLRGGDPVSGRLRAKDKIVNGLDDPSSLGFVFIIDQPFLNTGLFGNENYDEFAYTMGETDSNYSALVPELNMRKGMLLMKKETPYMKPKESGLVLQKPKSTLLLKQETVFFQTNTKKCPHL